MIQVPGKVFLYRLGMIYQQNNPCPPQKHLPWYGAHMAESAFRTPVLGKSGVHTCGLSHGEIKQHPRFRNPLLLSDQMPFSDNGKRREPTTWTCIAISFMYRCVAILSWKAKVGRQLGLPNGEYELHFFPRLTPKFPSNPRNNQGMICSHFILFPYNEPNSPKDFILET